MSDFIIELPEGWIETSVGQLTEPSKEKIDPTSLQEERNYIGLEHIKSNAGSILGYGISSDVCSSKSIFKKGDLLYGKLRPYLNKVYLAEIDGICSTDIMVFPKSETILNQYAKYRFLSNDFVRYANANSTGVQHPRVKFESLAEFPILLPPLNEQRRIVSTIEQLTDRSHKARAALEDVPKLIAQFRQSVLAAAFRGDLTADWREKNPDIEPASELLERIKIDRYSQAKSTRDKTILNDSWSELDSSEDEDLPTTWLKCTVGHIGNVCNGSTPSRKEDNYWDGEISWVSSGEVKNNIISVTREKITENGFQNSSGRILPVGTVLLAMIGEGKTRGQTAILEIEATINQNIAAVTLEHNLLMSPYLWHWFRYQYLETRRVGSGSGPQALNCQRVREMPFVLPPYKEQIEVIKKIDELLKSTEYIQENYVETLEEVNQLDRSILAKAFRGELVPQDPNDEPAPVLLERIRAEREQTSSNKQHGKTTRKNSSKQLSIEGIK
jgi:type I restriction enzyme, S subunit